MKRFNDFDAPVNISFHIDIHDVGHANYENDHNRVHIIYDRNAPKADDIANRIVCDSLVSLIKFLKFFFKIIGHEN